MLAHASFAVSSVKVPVGERKYGLSEVADSTDLDIFLMLRSPGNAFGV